MLNKIKNFIQSHKRQTEYTLSIGLNDSIMIEILNCQSTEKAATASGKPSFIYILILV